MFILGRAFLDCQSPWLLLNVPFVNHNEGNTVGIEGISVEQMFLLLFISQSITEILYGTLWDYLNKSSRL